MDSSGPGQRINNKRKIKPEGPNHITNKSKVGPGSAGAHFRLLLRLFYILFDHSGFIVLLFFIPWPGPGLCNDVGLLNVAALSVA